MIGPSGSGKGTQARLLIDRLGYKCIEMGKMLREEAKKDTKLGEFVYETIMEKGELLPDRIASEILKLNLKEISKKEKLIIDGYPRTLDQVKDLDKILRKAGRKNIKVLNIDVPESITLERLTRRLVCKKCMNNFKEGVEGLAEGAVCPKCHKGKLHKRADDTPEKIKQRLKWAQEKVRPVIEEYRSREVLVDIDGHQEMEKVYQDIINGIEDNA